LLAEVLAILEAVVRDSGKGALAVQTDMPELPGTAQGLAVVDPSATWLHPNRQRWLLAADGTVLGVAGTLHPDVRRRLDVPAEVAFAELDLDLLVALPAVAQRVRAA
jgi:phenylalanyl-tRNA synthetase beta subunit